MSDTSIEERLHNRIAELEAERIIFLAAQIIDQNTLDARAARIAELEALVGRLNSGAELQAIMKANSDLKAELETQRIRTRIAINAERQECLNVLHDAYTSILARSKIGSPLPPDELPPEDEPMPEETTPASE